MKIKITETIIEIYNSDLSGPIELAITYLVELKNQAEAKGYKEINLSIDDCYIVVSGTRLETDSECKSRIDKEKKKLDKKTKNHIERIQKLEKQLETLKKLKKVTENF